MHTQHARARFFAFVFVFVFGPLSHSPRLLAVHEAVHGRAAFAGGGGIPRLYHEVLLHVVEEAPVVVPFRGGGEVRGRALAFYGKQAGYTRK